MEKQYNVRFYTENGNEIEVLLNEKEFWGLEDLRYSLSGVSFEDRVMIKDIAAYKVVDIYENPEDETNSQKLKRLMEENPDLKLVFFVGDSMYASDGYYYTANTISEIKLEELASNPYNDEVILKKSENLDEFYCSCTNAKAMNDIEISDEEVDEEWDNLDWEKVILVSLDC